MTPNSKHPKPIACIILPTYNECNNIKQVIPDIFKQNTKIETHIIHVLVVDDRSPDGTAHAVLELQKKHQNLHLISGSKNGIGDAYIRGIKHAQVTLAPDLIIQMDADGQHDPELLPLFIILCNYGFNMVIGSRFTLGGETPNFSLWRKFLSRMGNCLIRVLGGITRIHDCTSGFRCIKAFLLHDIGFGHLSTRGYSFQSSLLCELIHNGAKIIEVPIIFKQRLSGRSKLSIKDQTEFFLNIFKIRFRHTDEFTKFWVIGVLGFLTNFGLYYLLSRYIGVDIFLSAPISIEISILTNFCLSQMWPLPKTPKNHSVFINFLRFQALGFVSGFIHYLFFAFIIFIFDWNDIISFFCGISIGTFVNYTMNSFMAWTDVNKGGVTIQ